MVMQEGYIFNNTIAKNIAIGEDYIDKDNIWLKLGGVLGMIVVLFFVERYYRSLKNKYMKEEEATKSKSSAKDDENSEPAAESE